MDNYYARVIERAWNDTKDITGVRWAAVGVTGVTFLVSLVAFYRSPEGARQAAELLVSSLQSLGLGAATFLVVFLSFVFVVAPRRLDRDRLWEIQDLRERVSTAEDEQQNVRGAILLELRGVRFRLAGLVYLVGAFFGRLDRELLAWIAALAEDYFESHKNDSFVKALRESLDLSDEALEAVNKRPKRNDAALSIPAYELPYLDSVTDRLSIFGQGFQRQIGEIKSQIGILNQDIEQAQHLLDRTFDTSIGRANQTTTRKNMLDRYRVIERTGRHIVGLINDVID